MGRHALFATLAVLALGIDQASKHAVLAKIPHERAIDVMPGFLRLHHVRNDAAAFGLLRQVPEDWRMPVLIAISGGAVLLILALYRSSHAERRASTLGLALVLGGALGNLYDRTAYGHVVDFIQFRGYLGSLYWQWPTFNAADVFITVGVGLLIVEVFRRPAPEVAEAPEPESTAATGEAEPMPSEPTGGPAE